MKNKRRVAVIGAGPAGAITTNALYKEQAFDTIRVFERGHVAGGTWYVSIFLELLQYLILTFQRVLTRGHRPHIPNLAELVNGRATARNDYAIKRTGCNESSFQR